MSYGPSAILSMYAAMLTQDAERGLIGIAFSYEGDYICGAWEDNKAAFQIHIDRLLFLQ